MENDEEKERNIIAFSQLGSSGATGSPGAGVFIYCPTGITVSRNSIFCNQGASIKHAVAYPVPVVTVNNVTSTSISGTAPPKSKIELFRDDSCINCEIKTYFDVTFADVNGKWSMNNINANGVVVTATDTAGMTSEASAALVEFKNFKIKDATCGQNNGSITGINIISGTTWEWQDANGTVISRDSVLKNVGPGDYRLVVGIGSNSCNLKTQLYQVQDISLPVSLVPSITPASCGQNNGAIFINYDINLYAGKWINSANAIIGSGRYLQNALPGNYTFQLNALADSSCVKTYGPFSVINQSGPSLNTNNVQIHPATCGNNTGDIQGIAATNTTAPVFIQWLDSLNNVVGNTYDLTGVYPGRYRLKLKDASGCDTITTAYYVVKNDGAITIDTSSMVVQPAKCSGGGGSIFNIVTTGGTSYEWKDISTGTVVNSNINATNLLPANYQLTVRNNFGCTKSTSIIKVSQATPQLIGIGGFVSRMAYCGLPNGSLEPQSFRGDTSLYSFRWVDSTTNQTISNYTTAYGIYGGTYMLYETDSNGCEGMILKTVLKNAPVPSFDYSRLQISPDNCLSAKGSINGIAVNNLVNGTTHYAWLNNANDSIGNSSNIKNLASGDYRLKLTDAMGCTIISKPITVDNINVKLTNPLYDDLIILKNTTASFTVKNKQTGTYQLFEDILAPPVASNNSGEFTTGVLNADKTYYVRFVSGVCESEFVPVHITVVDKVGVYIPTAFTPNRDGKNDEFKPIVFGRIKLNYFSVYNRWGQLIFSTNQLNKGWDGNLNGQLQNGVFAWIVNATDELTGKLISQKGTVVLIR